MSHKMLKLLDKELENLQEAGLYKPQYLLESPQGAHIEIDGHKKLNLSASDYLGMANDGEVIAAMKEAADKYGAGLSSQRIISGTQKIHRQLEDQLAKFFEQEEAALFASGYDANLGLFEALFSSQDYVFCDMYAHPGIIDGLSRSEAKTIYYRRADISDLEDQLKRSPRARFRMIVSEGIYSIDGQMAEIGRICELAKTYDALVMVHDDHGVGVLGERGRGTCELTETLNMVHLISGSFSQALSGVEGGFVVGPKELIQWVKQNAKPYVFTSSLSPATAAAAGAAINKLSTMEQTRTELLENVSHLRSELNKAGFRLVKSHHPIIAVVTNDAVKTQKFTDMLYQDGIFALGLCYPVVPKGFARIRLQLNIHHSEQDLEKIIKSFIKAGKELQMI